MGNDFLFLFISARLMGSECISCCFLELQHCGGRLSPASLGRGIRASASRRGC